MTPIAYVSDEHYRALEGVSVVFERAGETVATARSTATGGISVDLPAGEYRVTLAKRGFGGKRVTVRFEPGSRLQFRLLSDRLLGYAWPKWVRSPGRSEIRIHSIDDVRLSLWRYGLRKELVALIGWLGEHGPHVMTQVTPDGDYSQSGVAWNQHGYQSPFYVTTVAAPDRSALYYFHARTLSRAFFAFPWIVSPAIPQAPIAVLASTNTWNAYNNFGGRSNYVNADGLPTEPTVNARLDLPRYRDGPASVWAPPDSAYPPLSFDRPEPASTLPEDAEVTDPIEGRMAPTAAPGLWRLLGWLERERHSYDLYADYQLHAGELDLDAYRVLVLTLHPEYWSRQMFDRVKAWVIDRGGRLLYLGGNGINCEVEFADAATMRCNTHLIGEPLSAGGDHDSRFHRTVGPEASLLGVTTTSSGLMTAAAFEVRDGSHWAFNGTGLGNGDSFGADSLHERVPGGASGHETDKRSRNSPPSAVVLAKGLNPDDGGAEIVYYEVERSGGAVFSVGSITYVSSLLVDMRVSQLTNNVISRFLAP